MNFTPLSIAMAFLLFVNLSPMLAAQATRTWVSGVGDDLNPCTRTAPCKTFAGAISKTAAQGEIDVLDPGGFGTVTITKSITIDGGKKLAGILASATNGIVINAPGAVVILRNLDLFAANSGLSGIRISAADLVVVEHCQIKGFLTSGIEVDTATGRLVVSDLHIVGGNAGVLVRATATGFTTSLDRISITGANDGINTSAGTMAITRSVLSLNASVGILVAGGSVSVVNSTLNGNGAAALSSTAGVLRAANNDLFDNGALYTGTGGFSTGGNNRSAGNGAGPAPTSTIALQ